MTSSNLAYHGDAELRSRTIEQVRAHEAADEIVQGTYWQHGKGCFIGCIAHSSNAATVQELTGFPLMLTKIAESIFEGLPNQEAKHFPARVLLAPRLGADLSLVAWRWLHWCVTDVLEKHGTDDVRATCAAAVQVLADKAVGREVTGRAAYAAYAAADVTAAAYAAAAAADVTAAAYAAAAAAAAADAAYAATDAAYFAYAAAAAAADADAARTDQAAKLVEFLAAAPVLEIPHD